MSVYFFRNTTPHSLIVQLQVEWIPQGYGIDSARIRNGFLKYTEYLVLCSTLVSRFHVRNPWECGKDLVNLDSKGASGGRELFG